MLNYETTLVELFLQRIEQHGDLPAMLVKRAGSYATISWNELAHDVGRYVAAMQSFGVQPGDRVAQLSENRYEWIVADLAIMTAGAVHVPIHAPLAAEQVALQIRDSGAKLAFVSTLEQAQKLAAGGIPKDVVCLSYDSCDVLVHGERIRHIAEVIGDTPVNLVDGGFRELTLPARLATILYTSGTTGEPKGVMLTHRNLVSNATAALAMFKHQPGDVRLNFLPLSHIFARTCDLYTWLASDSGAVLALAENRETVIANCQEVHPTHLSAVPYFYDRVYSGLRDAGVAEKPGAAIGLLGGRVRMLASGGAPLRPQLFDYFQSQGLNICEGYGLTESSPVITLNPSGAARRGSTGRAIPDVEIRIADDGEILTRGPHVMQGYWQNEAATREVIDDEGWLYTGDLGRLDADGYLFITGRKKEIIVLTTGKKVAPAKIESLLCEDPLVAQALVVGDGRSYIAALIVPHAENLRKALAARSITATGTAALNHDEVRSLYESAIAARLECVSPSEQVKKFALLPRGFSIESGELTPKLSLRRKVIEVNFAAEVAAMYSSGEKQP